MQRTDIINPNLVGELSFENETVLVDRGDGSLVVETDVMESKELFIFLKQLNGSSNLESLNSSFPHLKREDIQQLIYELDKNALIVDGISDTLLFESGEEFFFEFEDEINQLIHESIYKNTFWKYCQDSPHEIPKNVLYGLAVEHYHFLSRQNYFDAPALCAYYTGNIRQIIMDFFHDEYRHDKIVLKSLASIGCNERALAETLPLPATVALSNALAYWSRNDTLLFFLTLGILEGKNIGNDTYVEVCRKVGLEESFIIPIEKHANINSNHQHGNLSRIIFKDIPFIEQGTKKRLRSAFRLFIEMYNNFYEEIWRHYKNSDSLLRKI